jgi:hypothetical protein
MSFLIYFFVLLVSAASVLFGLDLMSAPLPNTPNVPIGRSVQVVSPPPARQREARVADERALTPVYPTEPGKAKVQAETSGAASQEQAKEQATLTPPPAPAATPAPAAPVAAPAPAASIAQAPQAPQPQPAPAIKEAKSEPVATVQPATAAQPTAPAAQPKAEPVATAQPASSPQATPAQPTAQPAVTEAKAEPAATEAKVEPAVTAQQAALHASSSCNVQACGAAYHSFRAADCSYQPAAGGSRRACTMTRGATTASAPASRSRQTAREDDDQITGKNELRDVERIVKRQPLQLTPSTRASTSNGEMTEVERVVRHMTRGENADVAVQDGDGNIIVVRKGYR